MPKMHRSSLPFQGQAPGSCIQLPAQSERLGALRRLETTAPPLLQGDVAEDFGEHLSCTKDSQACLSKGAARTRMLPVIVLHVSNTLHACTAQHLLHGAPHMLHTCSMAHITRAAYTCTVQHSTHHMQDMLHTHTHTHGGWAFCWG